MRFMIYVVYSPENEILEHEVSKLIKYKEVVYFDYNEVDYEYITNEVMAIDLFVEQKSFIINNSKILTTKSSTLKAELLNTIFNNFLKTEHDVIFSIQKPILKDILHTYKDIIIYCPFEIEIQQWSKTEINNYVNDE